MKMTTSTLETYKKSTSLFKNIFSTIEQIKFTITHQSINIKSVKQNHLIGKHFTGGNTEHKMVKARERINCHEN